MKFSRMLGWWYLCIGLGFFLLGLRNFIAHAAPLGIALREVIAAGFVFLGVITLRGSA